VFAFFGAIASIIAFTAPEWYKVTLTAPSNNTYVPTGLVTYSFSLWRVCPNGLHPGPIDFTNTNENVCYKITDQTRPDLPGICLGPKDKNFPRAAQGFLLMTLAFSLFAIFGLVCSLIMAAQSYRRLNKVLAVVSLIIGSLFNFISGAVYYGFLNTKYCYNGAKKVCTNDLDGVTCNEQFHYGIGFIFGSAVVLLIAFFLSIFINTEAETVMRSPDKEPAGAKEPAAQS